jgi:hypothetical protein
MAKRVKTFTQAKKGIFFILNYFLYTFYDFLFDNIKNKFKKIKNIILTHFQLKKPNKILINPY